MDSASMEGRKRLLEKYIKKSVCKQQGRPSVYVLPLKKGPTPSASLPVYHLGEENLQVQNRVIMLLGATGAGKTTLVNGMVNYILGVQWEDDFRFKLIDEMCESSQSNSQTSEVAAYVVNHEKGFQVPYSLTVIDTPGFGSTKGIENDNMITKKIRMFFSNPRGIDHINSICFVVQAPLCRLTTTQKYIFDSVLSIFGKDIKENIQILITFADGTLPPVLEAIKEAGVPHIEGIHGVPVHFKFNNSALFDRKADRDDDFGFSEMFWKMGANSMKIFFDSLKKLEAKSLTLTKEVLQERKELETVMQGLPKRIQVVLVKMEELRRTQDELHQHKKDIEASRDFEYEVEINEQVKEDTSDYANNCTVCHFTCCYPCFVPWDKINRLCGAIGLLSGTCSVCPKGCASNKHSLQNYRYKFIIRKEKKTFEKLKQKYEHASGEAMTKEKLLECLQKDYKEEEAALVELLEKSQKSLRRLHEIALKPNPLSTQEYIDLLIQDEEREGQPGYQERIKLLKEKQKEAKILQEAHKITGLEETPRAIHSPLPAGGTPIKVLPVDGHPASA